jgi:hypothetical protein
MPAPEVNIGHTYTVTVDGTEFQGFVISLDQPNNVAVVQDQTDSTLKAVGIDQISGTLSPRSA